MVERSFFRQVKEALAVDAQGTLEKLGVNLKHGVKGEWSQCLCPFCGDKSGSASITQEGFLRCHQCGIKKDLFDWYAEKTGCTPWESCKAIGAILNLNLEVKTHRGRPPKGMTHDILRGAVAALWESDQAESCRKFLKARKLDNPQVLEQYGVGFISGYLIFAQWTPTGHLRSCYRTYMPGGTPPWMWKGGTRGGTTGFWPHVQLPKEGVLWLMEGEFDQMTASMVMELHKQGIYPVTWTGGAGSPVPPYAIPEQWHGREIHIIPDNDVFQGPVLEKHRAPDEKKKRELGLRWKILMDSIAPSFLAQNCKVYLRSIPIDPLELWGGDFRDWVDRGGRDLAELQPHLFKDLRPSAKPPVETDFLGVYDLAGSDVKFTAQVSTIDRDGVTVPKSLALRCDMGAMPYCANCKAPQRFSTQVIHCKDHPDDIAEALMSRDWKAYLMKHVVGKPPACQAAKLVPLEYQSSAKWTAVHDDLEQASERTLPVVSEKTPPLAGEVEIVGHVHHANDGVVIVADQIRELDHAQINLTPYMTDLKALCPDTDRPELIQEYFDRRCADLAANVTKIYGRQPIHLAHELLVHSTLWMMVDDLKKRGWLDILVIGDTRTGKTETFRRLLEHHRLGAWQNCGENISRAGLTMGGERIDGAYKVKPGLFPRNHKKMLILDEVHEVVKAQIFQFLQGARDDGRVFASKIFGSRMMPAAVRFGALANWPYDRERFRFMCEHLLAIYGAPERLSRMDFGIVVHDNPTESGLLEVEQCWTSDLVRALILRGWAMDETMIHLEPKAVTYAKQKCEEWAGCYAPSLPLFTPEEKHLTLLRMGGAVSNMMFCHPPGEPYHGIVKPGHVAWASEFLQKTWAWSEYEDYSIVTERKRTLDRPFDAEAEVTVGLSLSRAEDARLLLPQFLGGMTVSQIPAMLGREHRDAMEWISKMMRMGVLTHVRDSRNGYFSEYRPTKAGDLFLRNLILCAEDFPDEWKRRYDAMSGYVVGGRVIPSGLSALSDQREKLRHEWNGHG